jgi:hypothetical protein
MDIKELDQQAFPTSAGNHTLFGMTLRDYFAAKAMLGLMGMNRAEEFVDENGDEMTYADSDVGTLFVHTDFLVKEAYMIADMMLKARTA